MRKNNIDLILVSLYFILVLFGWLTAQSYFKDSTNVDVRSILLKEQSLLIEESLTPVGIIDDGLQEEVTVDSGDVWTKSGQFNTRL